MSGADARQTRNGRELVTICEHMDAAQLARLSVRYDLQVGLERTGWHQAGPYLDGSFWDAKL